MVGFLGNQFTLSNTNLGAGAEEHSTITLKSGTVVTGYFSSNGGPVVINSFNPKTKAVANIENFGTFATNYSDPYLLASDNGGFKMVYNTISTTGALYYRQYDASGNLSAPVKTLATGWIEGATSFDTSTGFFVSYRNRTPDPGEPEYVGAFYDEAGNLLSSFDFTPGKPVGVYANPAPQVAELANGNLAVVWHKGNLDGTFLQVFRPNGTKVGTEKALGDIPLSVLPAVVRAHPDGGFIVAYSPGVSPPGGGYAQGPITIQRYSKNGDKIGPQISFDTSGDSGSDLVPGTDFDVSFTKNGLIAITWTGNGVSPSTGTDVYLAVLSSSGKVITGPQPADETLNADQLDVQFNTLKNGQLFLTFRDDATVQFSHVASIQGRFVIDPDYIWEGNAGDNTNNGTAGDDVLLGLAGADTLSGGRGEDLIRGGNGNDILSGGNRSDVLYGENGDDTIDGDKGTDILYGGAGNDTLRGGADNDDLRGGEDRDTLRGGKGNDQAYGGTGNDRLFGDGGDDELRGEDGNDRMYGGTGNDNMVGGNGKDILRGNAGNDNLTGDGGLDKLYGGDGFDILRGGDGNDILFGGTGDDQLYGGDGRDRMNGEDGNDTFHDSRGNDSMTGGAGADTFRFVSTDFGRDRIKDFEIGVDQLDMGWTAYALTKTGGAITASDVAGGAKFAVDADNWVIIEGLTLSQLTAGTDYIIDSPI